MHDEPKVTALPPCNELLEAKLAQNALEALNKAMEPRVKEYEEPKK